MSHCTLRSSFTRSRSVDLIRFESNTVQSSGYEYETLEVSSPAKYVVQVELNRPEAYNALSKELGRELLECFKRITDDRHIRAVILAGTGKNFCSGIDYSDISSLIEKITKSPSKDEDVLLLSQDIGRRAKFLNGILSQFQEAMSSIEHCTKPVIAAIHGNCIGAAMSLIAACDIRYVSSDAVFQMREVEIGMAPWMGSLQRIPKSMGNHSLFKELLFSAKKFDPIAAEKMGLVSEIFENEQKTKDAALELATLIATRSPIAVQGSKICYRYSRDHTVFDGLRFMANWNMCMLQSEDLIKGVTAVVTKAKDPPSYNDL